MLVEQRGMRSFDRKAEKPHMPRRIASDVTLERDVPVPMSDGVQLMANVFRSFEPSRSPVLMSVTPYGKDTLPDQRGMLLMRLAGTRFGHLDCSAWTGFEAPDPLFWVRVGYAVVQADVRGMHKSEGRAGVLETGFVGVWWRFRMEPGHNKRFPMNENFPADRDQHPLDDAYWEAKRPGLERIEVPALVCASWSDHGLHTRGSLEGFERIASAQKWLYAHGGRKWETFYSPEAREVQRRFFDHFLKGEPNGWETTPRVRLAIRRSREVYDVRPETEWPLPEVRYVPLYLDAVTGTLVPE